MIGTTTAPVRKELTLAATPEHAFEVFTTQIATWWPLGLHSVFGERAGDCVFESGVGGRIYERDLDGAEAEWGRVVVWDPPHRVVFSWQPNEDRPAATEVEVRFTRSGDQTLFVLEHRGWERLGDEAAEARAGYHVGWDPTLEAYAAAVQPPTGSG